MVITHPTILVMHLSEHNTAIWKTINSYYQRQQCSPRNLLSDGIRFMRTAAANHSRQRRWRMLLARRQAVVDTPQNMKLNLIIDLHHKLHKK